MRIRFFLLIIFLLMSSQTDADTILLKSGASFEGTVVEDSEFSIKLDTGVSVLSIKKRTIEKILKEKPEQEQKEASPLPQKNETPVLPQNEPIPQIPATPVVPETPAAPQEPEAEKLSIEEGCTNLSNKLADCAPYRCSQEIPQEQNFTAFHTVYGQRLNKCYWQQTLPGKTTVRCALSENIRKEIAENIKQGQTPSRYLDKAFKAGECRVSED